MSIIDIPGESEPLDKPVAIMLWITWSISPCYELNNLSLISPYISEIIIISIECYKEEEENYYLYNEEQIKNNPRESYYIKNLKNNNYDFKNAKNILSTTDKYIINKLIKKNKIQNIPDILDLTEYVNNKENNKYKLINFIKHLWEETNSGHYIEYSLDVENKKWYEYDDKDIKEIDDSLINDIKKDAYMLMYQRIIN